MSTVTSPARQLRAHAIGIRLDHFIAEQERSRSRAPHPYEVRLQTVAARIDGDARANERLRGGELVLHEPNDRDQIVRVSSFRISPQGLARATLCFCELARPQCGSRPRHESFVRGSSLMVPTVSDSRARGHAVSADVGARARRSPSARSRRARHPSGITSCLRRSRRCGRPRRPRRARARRSRSGRSRALRVQLRHRPRSIGTLPPPGSGSRPRIDRVKIASRGSHGRRRRRAYDTSAASSTQRRQTMAPA